MFLGLAAFLTVVFVVMWTIEKRRERRVREALAPVV